jgi:hypothetical protein
MIDTDKYERLFLDSFDRSIMTKKEGDEEAEFIFYDLLAEVKRIQQDTLKVVSDWFDSDENEWRRLEQALGLPLTPLSWEGDEE